MTRNRAWSRRMALGWGGLLVFGLSAGATVARAESDVSLLPDDPVVAARTFERLGCARCHAVGDTAALERGGPNLTLAQGRETFYAGAARLWNHAPGMFERVQQLHVSFPEATGRDVVNLVAFFTIYQRWSIRPQPAGDPGRGAALFEKNACARCHASGAAGKGAGGGGSLTSYAADRSLLDLAGDMVRHVGVSFPAGTERAALVMSHDDMADIIAYLGRRGGFSAYVEPGTPARGAALFAKRGCVRCHMAGDKGRAPVRLPAETIVDGADLVRAFWNHSVVRRDAVARTGKTLAPFAPGEIRDLASYLLLARFVEQTGDPRVGQVVFKRRGCTACHERKRGRVKAIKESSEKLVAAMWRELPHMRLVAARRGVVWPRVGEDEMDDLLTYVRSLRAEGRFGTKEGIR